jgi:phage N-6-adenine-methyltransferase
MAELISLLRAPSNRDEDALVIGDLYQRARSSMVDSVHYLIEAGQRLIAKKKSKRHGEWLRWLEENQDLLGFATQRTAQLLMKEARKYEAGFAFSEADTLAINRRIWGHNVRGTAGTGDNEWFTPIEYIKAAGRVLGGIDLDPATHLVAQKAIKADQYFTRKDNGLEKEWHGRVWLNPPYAREEIGPFVEKLLGEIECGHTTTAIMLTHNYTDTEWFHAAVSMTDALCFTRGRVKFLDLETGEPCNPTQGQAFFYYGPSVELFQQVFQAFGFVVVPSLL